MSAPLLRSFLLLRNVGPIASPSAARILQRLLDSPTLYGVLARRSLPRGLTLSQAFPVLWPSRSTTLWRPLLPIVTLSERAGLPAAAADGTRATTSRARAKERMGWH